MLADELLLVFGKDGLEAVAYLDSFVPKSLTNWFLAYPITSISSRMADSFLLTDFRISCYCSRSSRTLARSDWSVRFLNYIS